MYIRCCCFSFCDGLHKVMDRFYSDDDDDDDDDSLIPLQSLMLLLLWQLH